MRLYIAPYVNKVSTIHISTFHLHILYTVFSETKNSIIGMTVISYQSSNAWLLLTCRIMEYSCVQSPIFAAALYSKLFPSTSHKTSSPTLTSNLIKIICTHFKEVTFTVFFGPYFSNYYNPLTFSKMERAPCSPVNVWIRLCFVTKLGNNYMLQKALPTQLYLSQLVLSCDSSHFLYECVFLFTLRA